MAASDLRFDDSTRHKMGKLCTLGMLTASVAHEMNNLLTLASGWLELANIDESSSKNDMESVQKAQEALDELSNLSGQLLDAARPSKSEAGSVDLCQIVHRVESLVDYELQNRGIDLYIDVPEQSSKVVGNRDDHMIILLNLMINAMDATDAGGWIEVNLRHQVGEVVLEVRDNGDGMAPDVKEQVFEPFFTTKGDHGTGLGLPLVKGIVGQIGGEVSLKSQVKEGTTVSLSCPVAREGKVVA
ncbi:MAG: sensor histidine kinase [Planctomycetota bacterium]